jgi:hypothetical protein
VLQVSVPCNRWAGRERSNPRDNDVGEEHSKASRRTARLSSPTIRALYVTIDSFWKLGTHWRPEVLVRAGLRVRLVRIAPECGIQHRQRGRNSASCRTKQEASHWLTLVRLTRQWYSGKLCLPNESFLRLSSWSPP